MKTIERLSVRGGPAVDNLLRAACLAFQLRNIRVLRGTSRIHAIAQARCYVASVLRSNSFSTPEIGKILGGKNPSTVFYYLKAYPKLLKDGNYSSTVAEAERIRFGFPRDSTIFPSELELTKLPLKPSMCREQEEEGASS